MATDLAARGLDIDSVDVVLNYDLPDDSVTYIHRVGRTARAGRSGHAFSFVTQYDIGLWLRIEGALGQRLVEYGTAKEEVMRHSLRVSNAQKVAARSMRVWNEKYEGTEKSDTRRRPRARQRKVDDIDLDEG